MVLNDLRKVLVAERVDLYLKKLEPIQFELWGKDDATHRLSEYRRLNEVDYREDDTMFKDYGNYVIENIYTNSNNNILNIDLNNCINIMEGFNNDKTK